MIKFPEISNPCYPLKEVPEDNSIRSRFEDGSIQSRVKFTRSRTKYVLTWSLLHDSEYQVLKSFIQNTVFYSAVTFMWTHPVTSVEIEVRITKVEEFQLKMRNYWSGSIELTEV